MSFEMNDKEQLMSAMTKLGKGIYEYVDAETFEDKEIAETFNQMLGNVARRNNNYLMRINQSMEKIGNAAWLKIMFEIIERQQATLTSLQQNQVVFEQAVGDIDQSSVRALNYVRMIDSNVEPVVDAMDEVLAEINRAEENGYDEKSMENVVRLMEFIRLSAKNMKQNIDETVSELQGVYEKENQKLEVLGPIVASITELEETCSDLSIGCIKTGRYIHDVSRLVDNVRNDMFRGNTDPTIRDSLRIYEFDHLVLTWRIYNHIMEYEVLVPEQLNNKDACKFGVWCNLTSPRWIRQTEEFKKACEAHEELHKTAVKCFEFNEGLQRTLALKEFENLLVAFEKFHGALEKMHALLVREGYSEETGTLEGNIF